MKSVPEFWWDFRNDDAIIVESDDDKYPIITEFKYDPNGGIKLVGEDAKMCENFFGKNWNGKVGSADKAILSAEKLIEDLIAGRADYRKLAKQK